jgi:hypothetical protein
MVKKIICLLFFTLILSGCSGMENGEEERKESIDIEDANTHYKGVITIDESEYELILNESGFEGIPLIEIADQLTPIPVSPEGTATINIENDPFITVNLWGNEVPVKSDSFSVRYETGRYIYNIKAQWANEEANYVAVFEVPYEFKRVKREKEPDNPPPWISSPNGEKEVIIEGYGEFESVGTIVMKELSSNTIENIDFNHGQQWTPKKIDWYDNDSVLTIIGLVHGTVTRGGDLYHLNINTLEFTPILELPVKEEVADFSIKGNQLIYEVHVYEDDEMTKGYMETRILDLSTIDKIVKDNYPTK